MEKIEELIKNGHPTIIDVRTTGEFMGGHVAGSINIPLNELPARMGEIKGYTDIVLCCASGGRSAQDQDFLENNGIECLDGGSWMTVNNLANNKN